MIEKINSISNVGKFESFTCLTTFEKNNIIFGFNGAGKSTLSDIFYSLAHPGKENIITQRATLKRNESDPDRTISINFNDDSGNTIEFKDQTWHNNPENVFVFNNQYVKEHVFVSKELQGNAIPIGMGQSGVKLMNQREQLNISIANLISDMNVNINHLSSAGFKFKDVTQSKITSKTNQKRYVTITNFELYPSSSESLIKDKIRAHSKYSKELDNMAKCFTLYSEISNVQPFDKSLIIRSVKKIPQISSKVIAAFLSKHLNTADIKWAVSGYKNQKNNALCPLCGQSISDRQAIDFFKNLGKYINQNKDENIQKYCQNLAALAGSLQSIEITNKISTFTEILQLLSTDKLLLKKDTNRLQKGLSWNSSHTETLDQLIEKIYKKADNPYLNIEFTDDENNCIILLNQVIHNITILKDILSQAKDRLDKRIDKTLSLDDMNLRCSLSFGSFRGFMEQLKSQANQMLKNIERLDILNPQIDDCYNQIQLDTVNDFLKKLNTNIKIEVVKKRYYIKLKDFLPMEYTKEKDNTIFSEGEQKAIAFAYFLAEQKNLDDSITNKTIIIDDPICSMDLCRKSIVSYQVAEFMKEQDTQVFILSHDISFIERITNFITSNISYKAYELNIEKNTFSPLSVCDYLISDEQVYRELISTAENSHDEISKILALISLRPYASVKKVAGVQFDDILSRSTYFSHTLYSRNNKLSYKVEDYSSDKLKEYIDTVNALTGTNFDKEKIIENYSFSGFDFSKLVNLYSQIPLNNIKEARKKVLLMRPLIEACFFQLSQRTKFDPENIPKMYKATLKTNKNNPHLHNACKTLYELYDSSKKYHHGADDGSLLGISWINPSEIEFYNSRIEGIVNDILSIGTLRQVSA